MSQLTLFSTEEPAPLTLAETLAALSRHGWDRASQRQKGSTTFYEFKRYDDLNELAEGELLLWLADLDRASAFYARKARAELPRLRRGNPTTVRSDADRAARSYARRITDVELRAVVEREIAVTGTPVLHDGWEEGKG